MMATLPDFVDDNCWFPDSGATNHVTNDLGHLSMSPEYAGRGKIYTGNAIGLPIHHIGHNSFFSNSRVLHLKILLHVPSITKNLISVSQFCSDNNVFFEFHSTSCFVKDQATKRVLLEGAVDGGLYKFHLIKNKASASPTPMVYRMLTRAVAQSLKHDRIFYLPWM